MTSCTNSRIYQMEIIENLSNYKKKYMYFRYCFRCFRRFNCNSSGILKSFPKCTFFHVCVFITVSIINNDQNVPIPVIQN